MMAFAKLGVLDYYDVVLFGMAIILVFLLLIGAFIFAFWLNNRKDSLSPYTGIPLRRGSDLSYYNMENVLRYLYSLHQYDNYILDFAKAAVCRDTGRIFPNAITWYDRISVDWTFLQKRFPGNYVSWGSLTDMQKDAIKESHHSLEGFQLEKSSTNPLPRMIEKEFAYAKPGPLYVDMQTKILIGWKCVPNTNLEVLLVQRPRGVFEPQM